MLLLLLALGCPTPTPDDTAAPVDTDTSSAPECAAGTNDCDGDPANGCETTGCCNPRDTWGNDLNDCDGDGTCECYGACNGAECVGE